MVSIRSRIFSRFPCSHMRYPREVGAKIIHLFLFGKDGREKRCVRKTRIFFNQIASSTRYAPGRCRHFHSFSDARESSWRRTCSKSPSYDSRVTSKIVKSLKMCFLWKEKTVTVLQNFWRELFPFLLFFTFNFRIERVPKHPFKGDIFLFFSITTMVCRCS